MHQAQVISMLHAQSSADPCPGHPAPQPVGAVEARAWEGGEGEEQSGAPASLKPKKRVEKGKRMPR